jgi:hypothetical protein
VIRIELIAATLVLPGCGWGRDPAGRGNQAFAMGGVYKPEGVDAGAGPPKVSITFLRPAGPVKVKPRGKIECLVELSLAEGEPLPTTLMVMFRRWGNDVGNFSLQPESRDGSRYRLTSRIKAPPFPGKYRLRVDAAFATAASSGSEASLVTLHSFVLGPEVEVQR